MDHAVTTPSIWTERKVSPDDLRHFRGDNAYVWQRNHADINYALTAYYLKAIDEARSPGHS